MKLTQNDLRRLGLPVLIMALLMAIGAWLAWQTRQGAEQATRELQSATDAHHRAELRLRQVRTEEQEIKDRSSLLQRMQRDGIAGEEKRLDWVELLRDIQRELRIPGMKYEFGTQAAIAGSNGWYTSPLRIQFRLLHEGDLLRALERIERQAKALVVVRNCKLSVLPASTNDGANLSGQLAADCEMEWLTVRLPETKS